jgi:hypothetical protein
MDGLRLLRAFGVRWRERVRAPRAGAAWLALARQPWLPCPRARPPKCAAVSAVGLEAVNCICLPCWRGEAWLPCARAHPPRCVLRRGPQRAIHGGPRRERRPRSASLPPLLERRECASPGCLSLGLGPAGDAAGAARRVCDQRPRRGRRCD